MVELSFEVTGRNRCPHDCPYHGSSGVCRLPDGKYTIEIAGGRLLRCPLGLWEATRNIESEAYELGAKVTARRVWRCNFCGSFIHPGETYFYVTQKGRATATLRCCSVCARSKTGRGG